MLEIFDYRGQKVRTESKDDAVWFVAADVCRVLDLGNTAMAVERLDADEKGISIIDTPGGNQQMSVVNEAGLYTLILTSRKPQAKEFKRWVTHEVLPSIRKRGLYAVDEVLKNPDLLISALVELKKERAEKKRLELENAVKAQQIAELQPKASYYDVVLACPDLVTITQIAKDFGMSAKKLNQILKEKKVQFKQGKTWFLYQKYAEQGYTQSKTYLYDDDNHTAMHTLWTQKGRLFIYGLLKADGILPVMERD